jgi:hypothetical protein
MDIVLWLRSLGLGKYEAAFRENEIDETVLPNLTAEDLKDLGVSIVGHRRKILDAIAGLRNVGACRHHLSRQHPRDLLLRRHLPRPSRKPLASADMSR